MFWILIISIWVGKSHCTSYNIADIRLHYGTAAGTSGSASGAAQNPFGSSVGSSRYGGATAGTSGYANAIGSNLRNSAFSNSFLGAGGGSAGMGSSASRSIFGNNVLASSFIDGTATGSSGLSSALGINRRNYVPKSLRYIDDLYRFNDVKNADFPVIFSPTATSFRGDFIEEYPTYFRNSYFPGYRYRHEVGGYFEDDILRRGYGLPGDFIEEYPMYVRNSYFPGYRYRHQLGGYFGDGVLRKGYRSPGIMEFPIRPPGKFRSLDSNLSNKIQGLVSGLKQSQYGPVDWLHGGSNTGNIRAGGTATASSGKSSAISDNDGYGSASSSNYGSSASGTSGYGAASGKNRYGYSMGVSQQGISTGTSGMGSSTAQDVFGNKGASSSVYGGATGLTSGLGESSSANLNNFGQIGGILLPGRGIGTYNPLGLYQSSSVAGYGSAAASGTSGIGGSSAAVAPGVSTSAERDSAASAAGNKGASASAGGVSAAAGRPRHKNIG